MACALEGLKISKMYAIDLDFEEECEVEATHFTERFLENEELGKVVSLLDQSLSSINNEQLGREEVFNSIMKKNEIFKNQHEVFKTSRLWLMYLDMIDLMCTFIKAERTGNWLLHLKTLSEMLPYFAASGHYLYAKSAYCYFVRKSDRFLAGIGTDLVIEQELMRPLKTTGGLTRGRGMSELQRIKWLLSTTTCTEVKRTMQNLTGVRYDSSEQHNDEHKECSYTRSLRDYTDALKILQYLKVRDPFEGHHDVLCIETGEIGDEKVNVFNSGEIGSTIIKKMVGEPMLTYSFTRKDMAVTMRPRSTVICDGERVSVDPQLLFQRLLITAGRDDVILKHALTFELCNLPLSLFGKDGLMREADKPVLADEVWKKVDGAPQLPGMPKYVLDGGSLVHKVKWCKGDTFINIFNSCINYVTKKYGYGAVVVFDGYPEVPTTKDTTHIRRKSKKFGRSMNISPHLKLNMTKASFLAVLKNQLFIEMLAKFMNDEGSVTALQAESDADLMVVRTAVELSLQQNIIVIGEDTDLLVLLIYHAEPERYSIYLTSERKRTDKQAPKVWDIAETKNVLSIDVCNNILTIHAILGCDTTSRIHNTGKGMALQNFLNNVQFRKNIYTFNDKQFLQHKLPILEKFLLVCYMERKNYII